VHFDSPPQVPCQMAGRPHNRNSGANPWIEQTTNVQGGAA
jgi:hypothetical protein